MMMVVVVVMMMMIIDDDGVDDGGSGGDCPIVGDLHVVVREYRETTALKLIATSVAELQN